MIFNPNKHKINHDGYDRDETNHVEQHSSRIQSRNMNSTTISNRKDENTYGATGVAPLTLRLSPMLLRKRLPRSGKKSSSVKSWLPAVARVRSPDFNSARRMERRREWL